MNRILRYVIFGVFLLGSLAMVISVRAAVTLVSFNAYPDSENLKISLLWETGSELDFSGFHILKGVSDNINLQPLTDENGKPIFIPTRQEFAVQDPESGRYIITDWKWLN